MKRKHGGPRRATRTDDLRIARGRVRRLVWREAALAIKHDGECVESYDLPPSLLALYRQSRARLIAFLAARGREK